MSFVVAYIVSFFHFRWNATRWSKALKSNQKWYLESTENTKKEVKWKWAGNLKKTKTPLSDVIMMSDVTYSWYFFWLARKSKLQTVAEKDCLGEKNTPNAFEFYNAQKFCYNFIVFGEAILKCITFSIRRVF